MNSPGSGYTGRDRLIYFPTRFDLPTRRQGIAAATLPRSGRRFGVHGTFTLFVWLWMGLRFEETRILNLTRHECSELQGDIDADRKRSITSPSSQTSVASARP
jgi:hypothetical protein